jgi:hypothetical protein
MSDSPKPASESARDVPGLIKILGFLSFTLSVGLILLIHHYLSTFKCPIPQ